MLAEVVVAGAVETPGVLEGNGVCCKEADAMPVCVIVSVPPLVVALGVESGAVLDAAVVVVVVGNEVDPDVDADAIVVSDEEPEVDD